MLPSVSGFDVLRKLGATYDTPILMLTARGDDVDRIVGLGTRRRRLSQQAIQSARTGGEDPRHSTPRQQPAARGTAPDEITVGPIVLNTGMHQVRVAERAGGLTGAEFRVLELLMRSAGQVLSRESMTELALGRKLVPYDRSIDTHISNLRRKLDLEAGKNPEIKNVRGAGYTLTWAPASNAQPLRAHFRALLGRDGADRRRQHRLHFRPRGARVRAA